MAEPLHMLTTTDNPYNPYTQWDQWYAYDRQAGYYTSELLARFVKSSDELSQADQDLAIENAIDTIVNENFLGLFTKVAIPTDDTTKEQAVADSNS